MRTFGTDFSTDIKIDRFNLDEECELQPSLYEFYSSKYAEAKTTMARAQKDLERTKVRVELRLRRNPPTDVKLTEGSLASLVGETTEVQDAEEEVLRATAEFNTLEQALFALSHRRAMLDNLVTIWIKDYYSKKVTSGDDIRADMHRQHNKED